MSEAPKSKFSLGKDKLLNSVTVGLFALGLVCVAYVLLSNFMKNRQVATVGNLDCVKETKQQPVSDENMAGLFEKGSSVQVLANFYNCNEAKRGDYALFKFSEQIEPVVRIVRGVPGDHYSLTPDKDKKGRWQIAINGETVKAGSEAYYIESNTVPPLRTYELSRNGILLPDEYILLSNKPPGLSDSSNLGLVSKKTLAGKVLVR